MKFKLIFSSCWYLIRLCYRYSHCIIFWGPKHLTVTMKSFVVGSPPEILRKLKSQTGIADTRVELLCEIDLGSPTSDVTWERNGRTVRTNERVNTSVTDKRVLLTINSCCTDDIGTYTVRASNKLATVESEATLDIQCKG